MRLRSTTIGTLNLFRAGLGDLNARDLRAAQALADVATIGILHERTVRAGNETRDQLQHALNSRVIIEQAKGVIAFTHTVSMDEAFARLRDYLGPTCRWPWSRPSSLRANSSSEQCWPWPDAKRASPDAHARRLLPRFPATRSSRGRSPR